MIHAFFVTIAVLCAIAIFPYIPQLLAWAFVGAIVLGVLAFLLMIMNELDKAGNLGAAFAFVGALGAIIAGCYFLAKITDPVGEWFAGVRWVRAYRKRFPHTGYWFCEGCLWLAEGLLGLFAVLMLGLAVYEREWFLALGGILMFGLPGFILHFGHQPRPKGDRP
jgi:hypothetical protein